MSVVVAAEPPWPATLCPAGSPTKVVRREDRGVTQQSLGWLAAAERLRLLDV
jgi:hypothetical protein